MELFLHFQTSGDAVVKYSQRDELLHHSYVPLAHSRSVTAEWDVSININSLGLRDAMPTNRSVRVLMLGDSFTWGFGVEANETFSYLLEQKLLDSYFDVDVVNAGVVSYSPTLEYLYLRERGLELNPDVVVLNFDMSDVQDDLLYGEHSNFDINGNLLSVSPGELHKKNTLFHFYERSKTLTFIKNFLDLLYSFVPGKSEAKVPWISDLHHSRYAITLSDKANIDLSQHWERTLNYIGLINDLCIANNITFVLTTYPYGHQVSPDEWTRGRHLYGFGHDRIYSDYPMQLLEKFAIENEILYINMLPDFKASGTKKLFFPYDGHFTTSGHSLASEILYREMIYLEEISNAKK